MGEVEMGSALKGKLKSLCCSGGWSYGVFWRFDPRNPMLLTFGDAYHEEQMGPLVNDMLLQVHILGEGITGKVAKIGKHQWIFSDNCGDEMDLLSIIRSRDEFQDYFEFLPQFSCGIKTIAIIPMKSLGVVIFGARQKILENEEFLEKTKKLSEKMVNTDGFILDNIPASVNDEDYNLNEWFDSLISSGNSCYGNMTTMDGSNSEVLVRNASFSTSITPLSPVLDLYDDGMTPSACQKTRLLSSGMPYTESPNAEAPSSSIWSGEGSILTSFESQLPSDFWVDTVTFPTTADSLATCGNRVENKQACSTFGVDAVKRIEDNSRKLLGIQHSAPLVHATNSGLLECATSETPFDFSMDISDFCVVDNISECFVPSSEDCIDDVTMATPNDLSKAMGVTSDLYDRQQRSVVTSAAQCDLFEGLGLNFKSSRKVGECWEEILMPAVSCDRSAISNSVSECISELDVAPTAGPRKGLFSELGIEGLLDCISNSSSFTKSNFEDQLSTTKRRRMDSLTANDAKMQHVYNLDRTNTLLFKKEAFPKSQVGLWIDDSYSIDAKDNAIATTAKRREEPSKATKKRARPGESTRPRPKDRQQIQDRLKELRGIIPNSGKCSIDSLLDLTIKHMHFLQSVTQYADELKETDKPKLISQGNGLALKDNSIDGSSYYGDATRAFDFSSQTMVCPIIVKDLNTRGHMLIEMLCEDRGFFLEIADIIRGFGLNILKGAMETREDKIWAHFIVETNKEVTGQVTRQDVFWSLLQLIQDTGTSGIDSTIQPSNIMDSVIPPFDGYQQSSLPLPISMADTPR